MEGFYYTYVLKSLKDNGFYIGFTNDLSRRLEMHNNGLVLSTKSRTPFNLVYFEGCINEGDAIEREKQLKTGFGRNYLKRRIK
jgi:putative endonuclease